MKKMDKGDFDKILEEGRILTEEARKKRTPEEQRLYEEGLDMMYARWQLEIKEMKEVQDSDEELPPSQ